MQKVQERTDDNRNQIDIGENLLPFEFCAFLQAGTCVRPEKNQLDDDESAGIHDIFLAEQSLNQGDDERSCIAVYFLVLSLYMKLFYLLVYLVIQIY